MKSESSATPLIAERSQDQADTAEALRQANAQLAAQNEQLQALARKLQASHAEVQAANQQLQALNASLESRVEERTADLRRRTLQLQGLARQLTQAEESERQRIAQLIHDNLQQLLVGARFYLDACAVRPQAKPFQKELQELAGMLMECLQASRSLTAELSPAALNEGNLRAGLEWLARWYTQRHGFAVRVEGSSQVLIDVAEIRVTLFQAVRELLFNALKHANTTEARVQLDVTSERVVVTVSDQGAGFDPAKVGGSQALVGGFGLFHIAERLAFLGGKLDIWSAPGQGSRFTLVVPNPRAAAEPETVPPAAPAVPPPAAPRSNKIRVLLADDHELVREGLGRALKDQPDFEFVGEAVDGRQAVDLSVQLQPDVVLMDVSMPVLTGIEATQILRTQQPATKVIAISMFNDDLNRRDMFQAGAVEFVDKTGSVAAIFAAIRQHAQKPEA